MPTQRVQPQDPSQSPTYSMSTNQTQPAVSPSIRRNLFAGHLSRRPVSQAPSADPFDTVVTATESQTQSQVEGHSQVPDLYPGPSLQPTKRSLAFHDVYDPSISPTNHPISPGTSSTMFPRDSIVAVNPSTGRPLLPNLPTLPPRLRLSEGNDDNDEIGREEDDDGDDGDDDSDMDQDQHISSHHHHHHHHHRIHHHHHHVGGGVANATYPHPFSRSPSFHGGGLSLSSELDMDETDEYHLGLQHLANSDSEESHRDRERIERLLADMQAQQRARAATSKGRRGAEDNNNNNNNTPINVKQAVGGVGAMMDPQDKEELMGLIMTSLRKKVKAADDEAWMFGEHVEAV